MKHLINLIIILSLFTQVSYAQKIKTIKDYKALNDSIASLIKLVDNDSINYVGKSFSEFVKQLDNRGLKIMRISIGHTDRLAITQHVYGVCLRFMTQEDMDFAYDNELSCPYVMIYFAESKPYEKALDLLRKYQAAFTEEVAEFYGDAIVQSLYCWWPDDFYKLRRHRNLPIPIDSIE